MAYLEWTEEMSVGIDSLDDHHKQLVIHVNDLSSALREGRSREAIGECLAKVCHYTEFHFVAEENYMRILGYPDYPEHKKLHSAFRERLLELRKQHESGSLIVAMQTLDFLEHWCREHFVRVDKKYTEHLKRAGVV